MGFGRVVVVVIVFAIIAVLLFSFARGGFSFFCTSNSACDVDEACVSNNAEPAVGWIPGTMTRPGSCRKLPTPGSLLPT